MSKTKFKKGDKVVMHTCMEADFEKYKGKIWTCSTDSQFGGDHESVFLEGFRGSFNAEFLQIVNIPDREDEMREMLKECLESLNWISENCKLPLIENEHDAEEQAHYLGYRIQELEKILNK